VTIGTKASEHLMSRTTALFKASPRKLLGGFGILLVAAAVAVGSGANFNSTSANPSNTFSAGTLAQSNSKTGVAVLTAQKLVPGGTAVGTVDIANSGDVAGIFSLAKSNVTDVPTSPSLSAKLTLTIEDMGDPTCTTGCPAAVSKYSGTLAAMGTVSMGSFASAEAHRYRFTVTFPDGGGSGADNAYKAATTTVDYTWTSVS
jgi:spore coat-associated protein N